METLGMDWMARPDIVHSDRCIDPELLFVDRQGYSSTQTSM